MTPTIRLRLNYPTVPKARARVTKNGNYHDDRYKNWKAKAKHDLLAQKRQLERDHGIRFPLPEGIGFAIAFWGINRGDGDNCEGAIMDALVDAGVWARDTMKYNPQCDRRYFPGKKGRPKWAEIIFNTELETEEQWRDRFPLEEEVAA